MAATKAGPRPPEFVGRPGYPVQGLGYRELIPEAVIEAIPFHKLQQLRRERFIVDVQPPAPRPESLPQTSSESPEHLRVRSVLTWIVEGVASAASVERDLVRSALESGAESLNAGGAIISIPAEAAAAYTLIARELAKLERREAK